MVFESGKATSQATEALYPRYRLATCSTGLPHTDSTSRDGDTPRPELGKLLRRGACLCFSRVCRCRTPTQLAEMEILLGPSWESFCGEALACAAEGLAEPYFYRSESGDELDLVLGFGGER